MKSPEKIVRRVWRPESASRVVPECSAHTLITNPEFTNEFAIATVAIEDAVKGYAGAKGAIEMAQEIAGEDRSESFSAIAMSGMLKETSDMQIPCDPYIVPSHNLLVDQFLQEAGPDKMVLKLVAYKLSASKFIDKGCDVMSVPKDDIELMLCCVGTFTVTVLDGRRIEAQAEGIFADDPTVMLGVNSLNEL
jgi:hypothetical protein